jgi:hypothetical protein
MTIAKQAEEYVRRYFEEQRGIKLVRAGKKDLGYDFRDTLGKLFVEVKGSKNQFEELAFRYFTNTEYEKARICRRNGTGYEVHLVIGIGGDSCTHYVFPGELLLEQGKPEVSWYLPIRKSLRKYRVHPPQN